MWRARDDAELQGLEHASSGPGPSLIALLPSSRVFFRHFTRKGSRSGRSSVPTSCRGSIRRGSSIPEEANFVQLNPEKILGTSVVKLLTRTPPLVAALHTTDSHEPMPHHHSQRLRGTLSQQWTARSPGRTKAVGVLAEALKLVLIHHEKAPGRVWLMH